MGVHAYKRAHVFYFLYTPILFRHDADIRNNWTRVECAVVKVPVSVQLLQSLQSEMFRNGELARFIQSTTLRISGMKVILYVST